MNLYCKNCNELLTKGELEKSKITELRHIDQTELLLERKYIETLDADYNFGIPIKYLVHSESINLKNHKDKSRFIGCCGPSNFDSLNKICPKCKSEIGVFIDDCWTSKFVGIDINKVSLKPLW